MNPWFQIDECYFTLLFGFQVESGWDFLHLCYGNCSAGNAMETLSGYSIPSNITICSNQAHVVFESDALVVKAGFSAKIHIHDGNCTKPGDVGYCTYEKPCDVDLGHCESNDQCALGLNCGFDNCPPALGFQNGTNCCFSRTDFCTEFSNIINIQNNEWTIQTPSNTLNRFVADIDCMWFFQTMVTGHVLSMTLNTFEVIYKHRMIYVDLIECFT